MLVKKFTKCVKIMLSGEACKLYPLSLLHGKIYHYAASDKIRHMMQIIVIHLFIVGLLYTAILSSNKAVIDSQFPYKEHVAGIVTCRPQPLIRPLKVVLHVKLLSSYHIVKGFQITILI